MKLGYIDNLEMFFTRDKPHIKFIYSKLSQRKKYNNGEVLGYE
ncbi:hypothetical protein TheetDRAFT_3046 [Thermoanaerobacter ethanolicus JW 200]|nr:hypothetical protein TheetDRAFT_3046 [Thermoanaerobacter ethanolicus JW 200]